MKNNLNLVKLILFKNLKEEKFLTFLSIFGISLGIALFIAISVASDKAVKSLESNINAVNSKANYQIFNKFGIDFNESIYPEILTREEKAFPVLKTPVYFPQFEEVAELYGVETVKTLRYMGITINSKSFLDYYKNRNSVIVPEGFLSKYNLKTGDNLLSVVYDKQYLLKIVGSYESELQSNVIFIDIGNFQELFNKTGYLSFIDLDIKDPDWIKLLPSFDKKQLIISKKEKLVDNQESLIASFNYNLQFISFVALLVGIFLLYNTIFITVVKKRTEIGILRSLGAKKKTIILLFTLQGVILGIIGSILGIIIGQFFAYFAVSAVEKTVSTVYSNVSVSDFLISMTDVVNAVLLGIVISFIASIIPAYEASKIKPAETTRDGSFETRYHSKYKYVALAGIILVICGGLLSFYEYKYTPFDLPFLSYIGVLLIILGFTFLSPLFLIILLKVIKYPVVQIFKSIGILTLGDIQGNLYRFSVAVMSIAISTALILSMVVLIFSFRNSLKEWINDSLVADIYIKPASCVSNFCYYPVSDSVIQRLNNYPEIEAIYKFRALQIFYKDKPVIAGFANVDVMKKYSNVKYLDRKDRDKAFDELANEKQVAISEYLRKIYGLKKGDKIQIDTPKGKETFTVNGVFLSYSTTSGIFVFDRKWLKKYWGLDDTTQLSLFLRNGTDVKGFERKLKQDFIYHGNYSLEILNNDEIRKKVLKIFDRSFYITYAIEFIAIFISLIGIANTLMAFVIERKREISIIRYIGGSWTQIKWILVLSAGISASIGIFLGVLLGLFISVIFIEVINQVSFGWIIYYQVPFFILFVLTFLLFLATTISGLFPSSVAKKIDPKRFISFE